MRETFRVYRPVEREGQELGHRFGITGSVILLKLIHPGVVLSRRAGHLRGLPVMLLAPLLQLSEPTRFRGSVPLAFALVCLARCSLLARITRAAAEQLAHRAGRPGSELRPLGFGVRAVQAWPGQTGVS